MWWFTSPRTFEHPVGEHWVLFAPDRPGLPMVVDSPTRELLHAFDAGADPGVVLASCREQEGAPALGSEAGDLVALLRDRGFVRDHPGTGTYEVVPPGRTAPHSFAVWMHVTNKCNLDCPYCFVDRSDRAMSAAVAEAAVEKIAETAFAHGVRRVVLKFGGGEPTLSLPMVERIHDLLRDRLAAGGVELTTAILTNGTCVPPRLLDFVRRSDTQLAVSLDGYGGAHDAYRVFREGGRGSWDLISENIRRLQDAAIRPRILTTLGPQNCSTLPRLVEWVFGQGLGMRIGVIRESRPPAGSPPSSPMDRPEHMERLNAALDEAFTLLEGASYELDLVNDFEIADLHFDVPKLGIRCSAGSSYVVMNEQGLLARCPMQAHSGTVPWGVDLLDTVADAFGYRSFERAGEDGNRCLNCRWFPVCVSGCPVHNEAARGDPFARSPYCAYYSHVIPRYVAFFGCKLIQAARRRGIGTFRALTHPGAMEA